MLLLKFRAIRTGTPMSDVSLVVNVGRICSESTILSKMGVFIVALMSVSERDPLR